MASVGPHSWTLGPAAMRGPVAGPVNVRPLNCYKLTICGLRHVPLGSPSRAGCERGPCKQRANTTAKHADTRCTAAPIDPLKVQQHSIGRYPVLRCNSVLKAVVLERVPGVRIPLPPPSHRRCSRRRQRSIRTTHAVGLRAAHDRRHAATLLLRPTHGFRRHSALDPNRCLSPGRAIPRFPWCGGKPNLPALRVLFVSAIEACAIKG